MSAPRSLQLAIAIVLMSGALPALGHHAFAAEYDAEKPVQLEGVLTKIEWINPHSFIYLDVTDSRGKVKNWKVEFGGPNALPGLGVVEGGTIPYQPWALEKRRKNFEGRARLDPRSKGYMLGVPRVTYNPAPFQILQQARHVTLVYEFQNSVRTIYTNGTAHPPGHIDWWLGDSRGHWEGDTLVVDVIHFHEDTWFDRSGNFHSDALHVVERYTPDGPDHILYEATIEDPKVFTRPWKINLILYRRKEKNLQLLENYPFLFDYEKYYP